MKGAPWFRYQALMRLWLLDVADLSASDRFAKHLALFYEHETRQESLA